MTTKTNQPKTARELTSHANLTDAEANEICRLLKVQFDGFTLVAIEHVGSFKQTFYASKREGDELVKPSHSQATRIRIALEWCVRGFYAGRRFAK